MSSFANTDSKLLDIITADHRTSNYVSRDVYRHPLETLAFFGINDSMTVVEITPGSGWYSEIIAPYLKNRGNYIAAGYDPDSKDYGGSAKRLINKFKTDPESFAKANISIMHPPHKVRFAKKSSVDMVVSFRNTHNWHEKGQSDMVFSEIYRALKPGGVFGIVQHRADADKTADTSGKSGYLKQLDVINIAEKAGLILVASSEINANIKDTTNHPDGVWSLLPSLKGVKSGKYSYRSIGESDRMTLKFIKPL